MSDAFDMFEVDEALDCHDQGEEYLRRWPEEDQVKVADVLAAEVRAMRANVAELVKAAQTLLEAERATEAYYPTSPRELIDLEVALKPFTREA